MYYEFPLVCIAHGNVEDSGMFAPDPSAFVLAHAMSPRLLHIPVEDVLLLSLSTGNCPSYHDFPNHNWGLFQWARRIQTV
jgi:hypothetical protein